MRFSVLTVLLWLAFPALAAEPPGGTIGELRARFVQAPAEPFSVRLEAIVTCFVPAWDDLFIHDGGEGIFVDLPASLVKTLPALPPGMRVRVEGTAHQGLFAPYIAATGVEVLASGAPPDPRHPTSAELFVPALDCHWVEVGIVVKTISRLNDMLVCEVEIEGARAQVLIWLPEQAVLPEWFTVERALRLRGVAATVLNDRGQMLGRYFHVPGFEWLWPEAGLIAEGEVALRGADELLRWRTGTQQQRVRVRGLVTAMFPGTGIFLRGEGGALFVRSERPPPLRVGEEVEVEGYPEIAETAPNLRAVSVRILRMGVPPPPLPVPTKGALPSGLHHELVQVEGELIEILSGRARTTLVCRHRGRLFDVGLDFPLPPGLDLKSELRLTGVCALRYAPLGPIPTPIRVFTLQLRSPADLVVLRGPSWWTAQRMLRLLAGTVVLAALTILWALALRRQVRAQTAVIREKIERESILEERERIARELHDTLEQELLGVNMLVDHAATRLAKAGSQNGAAHTLTLAARMLRHCREESRSSIRDLRSVALENRGLPAALDELLRPLATLGGAAFSAATHGTPRPLGRLRETTLLRVAHEAVANAARHSGAHHIALEFTYEACAVVLRISDDGCGFDPAAAEPGLEHFGLRGLRERTEKIGAHLALESAAGQGTTVTVSLPTA